ncbi:MAG: PKD-like domain-containing protein [Cyclobacteriaceae bacterium]
MGDQRTITITIAPEPVIATTLDNSVCSDLAIGLLLNTNGTSVAALNYDIVNRVVAGGLVPISEQPLANGVAANYLQNDIYQNTGNVPLDVVYTVEATGTINSCRSDQRIITITINPEPVMDPGLDIPNLCSGLASGLTLNTNGTSVAAVNYNIVSITVDAGLTANGANTPVPANGVAANYLSSHIFTNTGATPLNVVYRVVPVGPSGCLGDFIDITVSIDPEPVVDPNLNTTVCSDLVSGIVLNTNGVSVAAMNYDITAVVDPSLTGVATTGNNLAANAIQNDVFTNTTSGPLTVVYQVTPRSAIGCVGQPRSITLTVLPEPVMNPSLDITRCSDLDFNVSLATNGTSVPAASYNVTNITVAGGLNPRAGNIDPTGVPYNNVGPNFLAGDAFENTTLGNLTVQYTVVPVSPQGCLGDPEVIVFTIQPEPILDPALSPAPVCSDVPAGVLLAVAPGSVAAASYNINNIIRQPGLVAGGSNASIGPAQPANALINDVYTNTTNTALTVTYKIVPVTAAGCLGDEQDVVFTINPAPDVASNLNKTVCSNEVSGIIFATSGTSAPAANYNITAVNIQAGLIQTAGNTGVRNNVATTEIQSDRFQNPTNGPLTVTYSVQGVSGAGCLGPVRNIVLTVEPVITAVATNNNPSICSNGATNVALTSPTTPTSGVITFDYTAVSSIGGQMTGFVPALNNLPQGYTIADNLVNNSNSAATVTYTITPRANGAKQGVGCVGTAVVAVVTVEPKPKVVATPMIQTICETDVLHTSPTSILLTTPTTPAAGTMEFFVANVVPTGGMTLLSPPKTLYVNNETIADQWSNPTTSAQTVTYTLRPRINGGLACVGDDVTVTVTVNPRPTITASAQAPICSGDFVNITLTPDVANTIATWTVSAPATITGANAGAGNLIFQTLFNSGNVQETVTYTVTPKANNCDGTPITINVLVNPKPAITGLATTINVCHGATLNVPLTSTVAGTNFNWTVDNPSSLPGIPPSGSSTTAINQLMNNATGVQATLTYNITPVEPNGCPGNPKILIVTVAPQMNASFISTDSYICTGSSDFLVVQLDGQAPFTLVYNDGTSDITLNNVGNVKVIQVTPTVTTTYTIKSISDGFACPLTVAGQSVTVNVGDTDADFSVVGPAAACSPYQVSFQHDQVAGTEYTWQWFDGTPDSVYVAATSVPNQIIQHTFTNPNPNSAVTYKVTLRTALPAPFPGCFKVQSRNVQVYPTIITNAFPDRDIICSGESIQFFNQSFGVTSHRWFYRVQGSTTEMDVRTTANVQYTLTNTTTTNPIVYEVVYQANNGNCPAPDVVIPITVYRGIVAGFDEGTVPPYIGGSSVATFTNTSNPVDASAFRYEWEFGFDSNPNTANAAGPITVTYTTPGPKDVSIKATNIQAEADGVTCVSEFAKTIDVQLLPLVADYDYTPESACFPINVEITANRSTGDVMDWRVIDNNGRVVATSNALLPVFNITAPGEYSILLTNSSSLTGQVAIADPRNFVVYSNPVASFQARPAVVFVPDTELTTFNFSTEANFFAWDFGDGGTSDLREPKYTYKIEGVYDVVLVAGFEHDDGVVCTDTTSQKVTAKQGGITKVPNAFTPSSFGPTGGQGGSGTFNDVFLPIVKGVEEFNMQIFDRWGNLVFESNNATIGWDGYDRNGKLMPAGVYVYKLTLRLSDGQRTTQIGDITMIR